MKRFAIRHKLTGKYYETKQPGKDFVHMWQYEDKATLFRSIGTVRRAATHCIAVLPGVSSYDDIEIVEFELVEVIKHSYAGNAAETDK